VDVAEAWELCDAKYGSDRVGLVLVLVAVLESEFATVGDDGESRSFEPVESFVRFFLRNPRVGIKAAVDEGRWDPSADCHWGPQ
jgi:hypothetical protein